MTITILRISLHCALYGALAWTVYGLVEYIFLTFPLLIRTPSHMLADWHWPVIGTLFAVYVAAGLITGAAGGLLLSVTMINKPNPMAIRATATLPVVVAFGINIFTPAHPRISTVYAVVCILPVMALISQFSLKLRRPLSSAFAGPWAVSLLLLGPCVAARTMGDSSPVLKAAALLAGVVAVMGLVLLWRRLIPKIPEHTALAAAFAVTILASVALDHEMPEPVTVPAQGTKPNTTVIRTSPNIVLIVMDTVRADHLSIYGYQRDTTPNMKRLARAATVYQNAIATSDMSLGTSASMFTGYYASWHGAHYNPPHHRGGRPLDDFHPTIAAILAENGYRTAAVAANYGFFSSRFGLTRGFQVCDARIPVTPLAGYGRVSIRNLLAAPSTMWVPSLLTVFRDAEEVNQSAICLMDDAGEAGKPFFLMINYMDAHDPYLSPRAFLNRYPRGGRAYLPRDLFPDIVAGRRSLTEDEKRELIGRYDGAISYIDTQIAELVSWLKRKGLYDNVLLIITADHGEAFGEHGLLMHGVSLYQDQIHIPLIIKYPGQIQADNVDEFVSQVDLLPTILDVVNLRIPSAVQGVSLKASRSLDARSVLSESFPNETIGYLPRLNRIERSILHGSFKLIQSSSGRRELYDLRQDPEEQQDLYSPNNRIAQALTAELDRWVSSTPSHHKAAKPLDEDTLERLRSLGYVQ